MLRHKVDCPHCGNEITVFSNNETQKCHWCKRLVSVKFEKGKGKKFRCEVEPIDFKYSNHLSLEDKNINGRKQNKSKDS